MIKKERFSNLELLRIFCAIGIVIMHISGPMMEQATGINVLWVQIENGLFQCGVSIFILISGYFGLKATFDRITKLELKVLGYSVISSILLYFLVDHSTVRLLKSIFPIITNKYWFLTGYMVLMIFSPYINNAINHMSKKQYRQILLTMFAVFFVVPTVFYFDILGDNGKNIINMLFIYLLGGYIKKYPEDTFKRATYMKIFLYSFTISLSLNLLITYLTGSVHCPMSRDCSAFIVIEAVAIFMIFKDMNIKSNIINSLAKHVIAVYILESVVRKFIELYVLDYTIYYNSSYWCVINVILALVTVIICFIIDFFRDAFFDKIENYLIEKIKKHFNRMKSKYLYKM